MQDARVGEAPRKLLDIVDGGQAVIGSCRCCHLDLRLDAGSPFRIRLQASHRVWVICNEMDYVAISIEDIDDPLQRVVCEPLRRDLVVPFEMARVRVHGSPLFVVTAGESAFLDYSPCVEVSGFDTADQSNDFSVYFLATVMLCATRLQHGPDAPLLTQREISDRLSVLGYVVKPRTVRSYLDYYADRLGVPVSGSGKIRGWRRELLARTVVSRGIVRREHLRLIEV